MKQLLIGLIVGIAVGSGVSFSQQDFTPQWMQQQGYLGQNQQLFQQQQEQQFYRDLERNRAYLDPC